MTDAEIHMFDMLGLSFDYRMLINLKLISDPDIFDLAVKECFTENKQGKAVEALRQSYKAFRDGTLRGEEMDNITNKELK